MKKIITIFILIGIVFSGCKKYPEGPLLSLHTKKHRVIQTGKLTKYIVNGIDSTAFLSQYAYYIPTGDSGIYSYEYWFTKEKTSGGFLMNGQGVQGSWAFADHKNSLTISYGSDPSFSFSYKNIFIDKSFRDWEIMKLTNKEMHLKTIYNGNTYELFFGNH